MGGKCDVAAFIWPSYTGDEPRARIFWEEGIGEWQTVHRARAKYPGHEWPRKPLWGYVNEADPYVMQMEIEVAADHGIDAFIYDWYWYDRNPFLEQCLNNGYLRAKNNDKVKFYLMWANHNVNHLWDLRNSHLDTLIWDAAIDRAEFEKVGRRMIEKYFGHPSYYRIDGKPVLMIFDHDNILRGFGGAENARAAFAWLSEECEKAGLGGLHLQLATNNGHLEGDGKRTVREVGYQSATHYQFAQVTDIDREYGEVLADIGRLWGEIDGKLGVPYCPSVSVGWDTNPRFRDFKPGVIKDGTPEKFERGLWMAKEYLAAHPETPQLVVINSWNEWTETSYLQPDDIHGYGYLEAVRRVFGGA